MDVRPNNNALKELNDCIGGLLHLGLNVITFRSLLHLGPNVITFRTLLHLGQLLHLGLQHHPLYQSYQVNNDSRREEINTGNADVLNLVLRSAM